MMVDLWNFLSKVSSFPDEVLTSEIPANVFGIFWWIQWNILNFLAFYLHICKFLLLQGEDVKNYYYALGHSGVSMEKTQLGTNTHCFSQTSSDLPVQWEVWCWTAFHQKLLPWRHTFLAPRSVFTNKKLKFPFLLGLQALLSELC